MGGIDSLTINQPESDRAVGGTARLGQEMFRLNKQINVPLNLNQLLLVSVIAHDLKATTRGGAVTYCGLIFLKELPFLASENGMF